jgi:hypothetical protein
MRRLFSLTLLLAVAGLAGTAAADPLRLRYEAYAGGLHVMSFDIGVEDSGRDYRVVSGIRTRGLADFFVGMQLSSETSGKVAENGRLRPTRYLNQSKFGRRERALMVEPRGDDSFYVQGTPDEEPRTPIPAATLPGAVDPLTAMLQAGRVVAASNSCQQRIPVFDGRRRYDLVFTDQGERQLAASRYSVVTGPARLCKVQQERIGGFVMNAGDKEIGRESLIWIAAPLVGAPPVPVKLELDTSWGWLTIQLDEVTAPTGTVRLARDPGAK